MGLRKTRALDRHHRNLEGWNAQGFFSPDDPAAYTTDATIEEFLANAPAGEIGIYTKDGALVTAAPAAGAEWYFAQKNSNGTIKKSTLLKAGDYTVRKTDYESAFVQQDIVGWTGTTGNLNINIVGGLQEFVLRATETTPGNQKFPVMEGRAIVRSGSPTDYAVAAEIVRDFNSAYDYESNEDTPFAGANVLSGAVGVVGAVVANYSFRSGTNRIIADADVTAEALPGGYLLDKSSATAGKELTYKIISAVWDGSVTTITVDYQYVVQNLNVSQIGQVGTKIIANTDIFFETEANVAAADIGIEVTGFTARTIFETTVSEDLADATIFRGEWREGRGVAWQVASMEDECAVFDGFTTGNEAFPADYGAPDLWVEPYGSDQYAVYYIESLNRIIPSAGTPQNQTLMLANIVSAAIEGSTLETNLDTILDPTIEA